MIKCKNCNSTLCSIESDGKKQSYKCNSCGFIGKSSKLRGVAELYFLLGIGYDMSRHTVIENITIKVDAPILDKISSKEPMVFR